ncbi:MAG: GntR family transcriptional regulator [Erysipelotrichaceae bacterium]|nr:GntR family transcriptional regulator [Erysipelotrichaceae bacterium]
MFLINLQGKESIYEQIKNQISRFIETGVLKPNDKLPSCRELANSLGINPNTVNKAYQELEKNGYIYTLSKKGVYVSGNNDTLKENYENDVLDLLYNLKDRGYTKEEMQLYVNEVFGGNNA